MLALLCGALWITIAGANYPSEMLANFLLWIEDQLTALFMSLGAPNWLHGLMDGVILLAFILEFPANEIVFPIIIMTYMATGALLELDSLAELKTLLVENGWTWVTAVSTMLFCLCHWPCSTACLTIKKETGSYKWAGLSIVIPTAAGIVICFLFATVVRLLGL